MSSEIRQRIVREASPEEKERHRALRENEIERELPELKQWARVGRTAQSGAGRNRDGV